MKEFTEAHNFKNPPSELFRDIACNVVDFYNLTQECCGSDKRMEYPKMSDVTCEMCGSEIDTDTNVCPECKETVNGVKVCDECNGQGHIDVLKAYQGDAISPRYESIVCENCKGEGMVEA